MSFSELIRLGSLLKGHVVGLEGNISKKTAHNEFAIKASGCALDSLTSEDFVKCNLEEEQLDNHSRVPSIECGFHSWIYSNSNYTFIAHTHPTNTLKILCSGSLEKFSSVRLFPDQVVFLGKSYCVVPYALPGKGLTKEIQKACSSHPTVPKLLLLENHGIICCGNSAKEVAIMTDICDKASEIFIESIKLGQPKYLSPFQIKEISTHTGEKYRRSVL